MSKNTSSGSYQIDLPRNDNWMLWKQRILAILRDKGLEKYVSKDTLKKTTLQKLQKRLHSTRATTKKGYKKLTD